MARCTVSTCNRVAATRGLCYGHYQSGNPAKLTRQDLLAVAYHTGRIDRRRGNPYRTTRTDAIGRAYARGYEGQA